MNEQSNIKTMPQSKIQMKLDEQSDYQRSSQKSSAKNSRSSRSNTRNDSLAQKIRHPSIPMTSRPSVHKIDQLTDDDEPLRVSRRSSVNRKQKPSNFQGPQPNYQRQFNEKKWAPVTKINLMNDTENYKTFNPDDSLIECEKDLNQNYMLASKTAITQKRHDKSRSPFSKMKSSFSRTNQPTPNETSDFVLKDGSSEKKRFSSPTKTKTWLENQKGYFQDSKKMKTDMNNFCVECQGIDPQWVSVNNGIFICINCAGQHRGFGVQVSFVRSLEMDKIDDFHLKMLKYGGNRKFLEFISLYDIQNTDQDRHSKYITKACDFYRQQLSVRAINDVEEFEINDDIFYKMPKLLGQQYIYEDSYVNNRRSSVLLRKQEKNISLIQEATDFGQYVKEQIVSVRSSLSCVRFNCKSRQTSIPKQEMIINQKSSSPKKPHNMNYNTDINENPYRSQQRQKRSRIMSDYNSPVKNSFRNSDNEYNYSVRSIRK